MTANAYISTSIHNYWANTAVKYNIIPYQKQLANIHHEKVQVLYTAPSVRNSGKKAPPLDPPTSCVTGIRMTLSMNEW